MGIFGFDFDQFVKHEMLENLIRPVGSHITKEVKEKVTKKLEAHFGGLGVNDNLLSMSAAQIAHKALGVELKEINRIANIFKGLTREERNKVTSILGPNEQDVNLKMPKGKGSSQDQTAFADASVQMNMRGAVLIVMLAEMTDEQILNFLTGFGALDTTSKNINDIIRALAQIGQELEQEFKIREKIIKPLDDWAADGGNLERIMAERRAKRDKTLTGKIYNFLKKIGVYS
jgi:hypothetical protein